MLDVLDFSVGEEIGRVEEVFSFYSWVFGGRAYYDCYSFGFFGEGLYGIVGFCDEVVEFEEVTGGVSAGGEFAEHDDVGFERFGFEDVADHFFEVSFEVSDVVVELSECDFHYFYF